jgi:arabinose-5-phosphate isomerase
MIDIVNELKEVINREIKALESLCLNINDNYIFAIELIKHCNGKVIISGVGKSALVGKKISSTLCSLGIPSIFLHSNDALHGDLGLIENNDILILISNSGEADEIKSMFPIIKEIGLSIISITSNEDSFISKNSDVVLLIPVGEADHIGCAPTSSTTSTLVLGDALAVVLSMINNFNKNDFKFYHPAGSLGKR